MKDFLLAMSKKLLGKDGLIAKGSTLLKADPKVKDFKEKFIRYVFINIFLEEDSIVYQVLNCVAFLISVNRPLTKPIAKANYDDVGGVGGLFG